MENAPVPGSAQPESDEALIASAAAPVVEVKLSASSDIDFGPLEQLVADALPEVEEEVPAESIVRDGGRHVTKNLLTAAGVEDVPVTTFEVTQGPLGLRKFVAVAIERGFDHASRSSWPSEAELGFDHGEVLYRDDDSAVFLVGDDCVAYAGISRGWAQVSVASASRDEALDTLAAFTAAYPPLYREADGEDTTVPITFWSDSQFGPTSRLRRIESAAWDDIAGNYTADVRAELARLSDGFEPGKDGQLLLWQGPPGTGKTWALRALASEWAPWAEFHYITDPDAFFVKNPSYMIDVLLADSYEEFSAPDDDGDVEVLTSIKDGGKWRILILEDTGELLSANAKHEQGQGLSRLLNVVDGMVGQGLRVLALVTTNDELGDLHPAVVRPGRCASQIEFGPLSAEEAAAWVASATGDEAVEFDGPKTLAELFQFSGADTERPLVASLAPFDEDLDAALATDVEIPAELAPGETLPERRESPAAPEPPAAASSEVRWIATLAPEGKATDDGRVFAPGSITWRELPLSLMAMIETGPGGHEGAELSGRMDEIWREDATGLIRSMGVFESGEYGQKIAELVGDKHLRGVSVDIAISKMEIGYRDEVLDADGNWIEQANLDDEAESEDMPSVEEVLFGDDERELIFIVREGVIGMATVCPFPAFADAKIELDSSLVASVQSPMVWTVTMQAGFTLERLPAPEVVEGFVEELREAFAQPITASAAGIAPEQPPAEWFEDPQLEELTGLTVTHDGRVFGHAAAWDTCHIGIPGVCTTAPKSEAGYAYFHLKEVVCADGSRVACGTITLDTGHADRDLGRASAAAHYDDTGTATADVVVGEDEHGIWFSGALRADADAVKARKLGGAVLSGDWRDVNGSLELVALLAVNVPGFPVPRTRALVAAGDDGDARVLALVAAGVHVDDQGDRRVVGIAARGLSEAQAATFAQLADEVALGEVAEIASDQ